MTIKTITTARIKGDWMKDGYIDNLNRRRRLAVAVFDGVARDVDDYGHVLERIKMGADGNLRAWGADISFSPDDGEIERVGKLGVVFHS